MRVEAKVSLCSALGVEYGVEVSAVNMTKLAVKRRWVVLAWVFGVTPTIADSEEGEQGTFARFWNGVKHEFGTTWREGSVELLLPLYTWHLPFAYDDTGKYTNYPAGIGLGKGRTDEKGNWHNLYAMVFRDSHGDPEPAAGYAWAARWGDPKGAKVGVGYTVFLTARSDYNWVPFPGILPIATVEYNRLAVQATYVPGQEGIGNVILFWGKYTFDK
jgi:palmitoyl transferase